MVGVSHHTSLDEQRLSPVFKGKDRATNEVKGTCADEISLADSDGWFPFWNLTSG